MNRLVRLSAALALLSSAGAAHAFVRETTTVGNPASGKCLWWGKRQVTYVVNPALASNQPCGTSGASAAAIAAALATWGTASSTGTSACTDFTFVPASPAITNGKIIGDDQVNTIIFRQGNCDDVAPPSDPCHQTPGACGNAFNCWEHGFATIGLTTTSFDTGTGEIHDADMELNAWNGQAPPFGAYFTCGAPTDPSCSPPPYGKTGCNAVDLQAVATHEAGHMLGLDHTCQYAAPYDACPAASVMAPSVGNVALRALGTDDVTAVCTIYPAGKATLTCSSGTGGSPKSGGCGTGPAGTGSGVLLGLALVLWRLRRRAAVR